MAIGAGPLDPFNHAISFMVNCADQAEIGRAVRARLGSIIGGFDAAQSHRRMRGFRATRAHVNTLIAASGETTCS